MAADQEGDVKGCAFHEIKEKSLNPGLETDLDQLHLFRSTLSLCRQVSFVDKFDCLSKTGGNLRKRVLHLDHKMHWNSRKILRFNLLFWAIYFVYEWLGVSTVDCLYNIHLLGAAGIVPITFLATMFTVHILIRKFFQQNKKTFFWLGLIVSVCAFALIRRAFNYYTLYPILYPQALEQPYFFLPKLLFEAVNIYLIVGLYTMFFFGQAWYEQQRITQTLQKDKIEAQLELLKSQVHPHFIFNTLNNMYALALKKNDQIPDLIYRLSSFLSYSLYDGKMQAIPIAKELDCIRHYIELEKIRHGDRLDVSVNVYNALDGFMIGPLLLLPLVENCYKHGVSNDIDKSWIRIDLSMQQDWLTIKIENSVANQEMNGHNLNGLNGQAKVNSGLGLSNVRQRLEILYPGKHDFKTMQEDHSFLAILKIKNYAVENSMPYSR